MRSKTRASAGARRGCSHLNQPVEGVARALWELGVAHAVHRIELHVKSDGQVGRRRVIGELRRRRLPCDERIWVALEQDGDQAAEAVLKKRVTGGHITEQALRNL